MLIFGALALGMALLAADPPLRGASTDVVISEFRVRGPNGGSDEFVELYNASSSPVVIGGWKINGSNASGTTGTRATITGGVVLNPGCHYLVTNSSTSGGPYSGSVAGNQTYGTGITDDGGIALLNGSGTIIDMVGMSAGSAYKEGTPLASLGSSNLNRSYERKPGGTSGSGADTDNNASDFQLISPSDPQNLASPCIGAPTPPTGIGTATPSSLMAGDSALLAVTVTPGANPSSTGIAVAGNLSAIDGIAAQPFFDDGTHGDVTAGDNIFSFSAVVATGTAIGAKSIAVTISDAQARSSSTSIALSVAPAPTAIHDIQGPGLTSPYAGQLVTTRGVVTALRFNNGFFIQEPDALVDADPNTSEGIFVFTSSAPPPAAALGAYVQVTGTVAEYIPSSDPYSPPMTEIASPTVTARDDKFAMPAAVALTAADLPPSGTLEQLERFEGMRVHVAFLRVVGPTAGSVTETSATGKSNGVFFAVIDGVARPFREAGVQVPDPLPDGAPATIPRFDGNPERLRVDSDGQIGASPIEVTSGALVSNVVGVLDYAFRTWTILPDASAPPVVSGLVAATPVPAAGANEFSVASFNMERFFDATNDPAISEPILTAAGFERRLNKASLAIRTIMGTPDILGVEEVENLATLATLAARVNADALAAGDPSPAYTAYLMEGNDIGGIDVGLLVKSSRVDVIDVVQEGKDTTYTDPVSGLPAMLNDRPPLVLRAEVHGPSGSLPVTVVVNHLRSLDGIDDPVDGPRVRAKRLAQADFLAGLIQARQTADPNERIISVGDYNAYEVNDGYVDVMGSVRGAPAPADQVVLAGSDLVDPDLTDLVSLLTAAERYSYVYDGTAQVLDHIVVNPRALQRFTRLHHARANADFPESLRSDGSRPERLSDHDAPVAYFAFPNAPVLKLQGANPMAVECCSVFVDPGATASDDDLGDLTALIAVSGTVDEKTVGSYTLTYSVSNFYTTTTATRTVNIVDTTPPVLTLAGPNPMSVEVGSGYVEPGASASDTCAGDLSATIVISGGVNSSRVGTYLVTYAVSDGYNTTSVTRTVNVVDTTPPVLSAVTPSTRILWPPRHDMVGVNLAYTVTDNSGAAVCAVGVVSNEPVNGTGDGDTAPDWIVQGSNAVALRAERAGTGNGRAYTLTVTCRDASDNASTAVATVLVPKNNGK